jgi:hypothetical protein
MPPPPPPPRSVATAIERLRARGRDVRLKRANSAFRLHLRK